METSLLQSWKQVGMLVQWKKRGVEKEAKKGVDLNDILTLKSLINKKLLIE